MSDKQDPKVPPADPNEALQAKLIQDLIESLPPTLPELRLFVVTRYVPGGNGFMTEHVYVNAHMLQYSGSVLMCQQYVIDSRLNGVVERTVRAFNSWVDVEAVPVAKQSVLTH